jgi:GTP-binding protein
LKAAATDFIRSAAGPRDFPADGAPEIALVGRSNVGKSSLINALAGQRVARTSAKPGKTRLANIYRVHPAGAPSFYMVDLPGFGYARGGAAAAREFEVLTAAYFNRQQAGFSGQWPVARPQKDRDLGLGARGSGPIAGVVFAVDSRHPGLRSDVAAGLWLPTLGVPFVVAATKVDTLSQADRARLREQLEPTFGNTVLPVSATTGEGLRELWKLLLRWISIPRR